MNPSLIVTTCGISVLMFGADAEVRRLMIDHANFDERELADAPSERLRVCIEAAAEKLAEADDVLACKMSAEIKGVAGLYDGDLAAGARDQHVLLHTDTWLGEQAAEAIRQWLSNRGLNVQTHRIDDLKTSDLASFHAGLNRLVLWCEQTVRGYRDAGHPVVFNLTGGFKSLQGFMQTLGMFYADEMIYIFESGTELLRIPKLPIEIEAAAVTAMEANLPLFRKLDDPAVTVPVTEASGIPESFFFRCDDDLELSPWGRIVWQKYKGDFYSSAVLEPLSDKLAFSAKARKTAEGLSPTLRGRFNQRMDDLARYLDSSGRRALNRLDFKQLRGNPCPPSTHECDLWADQGAWRAFAHYEGERLIVDNIGPGLH